MRKFFSAALLLVAVSVYAQDIQFGAKAGLNVSSIYGDEVEDAKSRTSFHLGLSDIPDGEGSGSVKNGVFQVSVGYFFL